MTAWPVVVFGAPGALVGLGLCVAGLAQRRPWFLVAGGLVLAPSSVYLGGQPGLGVLLLLPLLPLVAAFALSRGHQLVAGLLIVPNAAVVIWMCVATIRNLVVG